MINTIYTSINIFGDDMEVAISYEELLADQDVGLENGLCITAVKLQRADKWDGNGNVADTIHSVDLLPFLSEWGIRDVEETVAVQKLVLAAQERRTARLARVAA